MTDYVADIRRYTSDADEKVVQAIVKHLGIALKSADASVVSCSDKGERDRVKESWLKKKLGLELADKDLDQSVKDVCEMMKADKNKQRVTFYYLLAHKHGKLAALAG